MTTYSYFQVYSFNNFLLFLSFSCLLLGPFLVWYLQLFEMDYCSFKRSSGTAWVESSWEVNYYHWEIRVYQDDFWSHMVLRHIQSYLHSYQITSTLASACLFSFFHLHALGHTQIYLWPPMTLEYNLDH